MPSSESPPTRAEADLIARCRDWLAGVAPGAAEARCNASGAAVVAILEPFGLPSDITAAAFLRPAFTANALSLESLENSDLKDLSRFIIGLRQLDQFSLPAGWQPGDTLAGQQSEALRKMLLAIVSDPRLVLVRIAEQLQHLRDARELDDAARRDLAVETREIYAPLANRLGIWQLKWELEDFAFRYLEPDTYAEIARSLREKRGDRERYIADVAEVLRDELEQHGLNADVSGRPKHIYSIYRKMQRKGRGLDALYDIRAVRVLVDDVQACYTALGIVHNKWPYLPGEFDDYIANPKDNDYRSLHTAVIGPDSKTVEVQIRSHAMHRHAELGVAAHWRYKEGTAAPSAIEQKVAFLRQLLEPGDDGTELLERIRDDVLEDRVYAVSPRGDIVELPAGATPLDFAYHVHTMVGHRCRGAKVNGRIVPLTHRLANGDHVHIITGSQPRPSRDWLSPKLGYLASARNRAKVRNWFRQQDRDQHLRQGRDILDREFARLNVDDLPLDAVVTQLQQESVDALCIALGNGDLAAAAIANALHQLRGDEKQRRKPRRRRSESNNDTSVAVQGVGDLLCNFARCCRPVPPEAIGGYITQGRGVSIHRADCGNFLGLETRHPERVLETRWGDAADGFYPVDLSLRAYDRAGLIRDISTVVADASANIVDLTSHTDKRSMQAEIRLSLEIRDLPTLGAVMSRLEQLPNVVSVRRRA